MSPRNLHILVVKAFVIFAAAPNQMMRGNTHIIHANS